jgi:hypothetical protein
MHHFLDTFFGINYPLFINLPSIETSAMPTKKNPKSKANDPVSAIVFDKQAGMPPTSGAQNAEKVIQPITASVFINEESDLTFKTKMRNIVQYTFECLRDNLLDLTPVAPIIQRSMDEMRILCPEADRRLSAETSKRFHELIEEIKAFTEDDPDPPGGNKELRDVMHYRHYVRIAWLSHFILEDIKKLKHID